MQDPRIEGFVVKETNLLDQVIGDLCRKFFLGKCARIIEDKSAYN